MNAQGTRRVKRWACASAVGALVWLATGAGAAAQGLKLAKPEQLLGIPLASTPFSGAELPAAVDLSDRMPPPGQQGQQNSCVGWTLAYALKSYQESVEERWSLAGNPEPQRLFSPAFIYNQINNGRDGGCLFVEGLRVLSEQGAATLAEMPYRDSDFTTAPNAAAREHAKRYRIDFWRQVNIRDVKEVKAQLNAGYPVLIGASVDKGFKAARTGFVWRELDGEPLGGHAMCVVGYNDQKQAFRVLNSWGREWADAGYGWIDYQFFVKNVNEGYVAKDARNAAAEERPPEVATTTPTTPPATTPPPTTTTTENLQFVVPQQFTMQQARLTIQNVQHNVPAPWLNNTPGMQISGTLSVPRGRGTTGQVVLYFFFNDGVGGKGQAVRSIDARFADGMGLAATGTQRFALPNQDMVDWQWNAYIPYACLVLRQGGMMPTPFGWQYQPWQNLLLAEAVLFVDNFGAANGGLVPFVVVR